MALVVNLYPSQSFEADTLRGWAAFWVKLAKEYGPEMMDRAVSRHMLTSKFFPQPAELREHLEALRDEDRAEAARVREEHKFVPCGRPSSLGHFDPSGRNPEGSDCDNGWRTWWSHQVMGPDGKAIHSEKLVRVTAECRCLKRWKAGALPDPKLPQSVLPDGKSKGASA